MVTRTGSKLLEDSAINAYKKLLLPIADLVTPNIYEANLLSGLEIRSKKISKIQQEKLLVLELKRYL